MKRNYTHLIQIFALLFCITVCAQSAQKNFINYQGVARDAENTLMEQENLEIGIRLKFGSSSSTVVYAENHSVVTDANGVFSLKIGNGDIVSGDYNNLPWGTGATFVTVSINGNQIGTTEMMAVPYAITSGDGDNQSAAEVPYNNTTSGLTATTTQDAIDELSIGGTVDADADPTNEIQSLSFDAETNELSLSDGNSVVIPSGGTDADSDPTNELQDISLTGTALSISNGSTVDLAPIVVPAGSDNQELTFDEATKTLEIEDGNTVDLSSLSVGGGSPLWTENGNKISYNSDNVGIGETNPSAKLHIKKNYNPVAPFLELESTTGDRSEIRFSKAGSTSFWDQIAGVRTDAPSGTLSYYYSDAGTPNHIMTLRGDKKVGINTFNPTATLDVNGSFNINGDFENQSFYKVPLRNWTPPESASSSTLTYPGAVLQVFVPAGSKVLLGFAIGGHIDSDDIRMQLAQDDPSGGSGVLLGRIVQSCYEVGGSKAYWNFSLSAVDNTNSSTSQMRTYRIYVDHSDDAEDCLWLGGDFYAIIIKV